MDKDKIDRYIKKQRTELVEKNTLLKVNFDIKPKKKQLKNIVKQKAVFNSKPVKMRMTQTPAKRNPIATVTDRHTRAM